MSNPATLQDVADKTGVHRSTVSLALRNSGRISQALRQRINAVAAELGYRPNPLVTALMKSRRFRRLPEKVILAYVTNYPTRYGWRPQYHDRPDYFPGAERRAAELGYKLEDFWLAEPLMTPDRFARILSNRGINGLIIGRLPPGTDRIDLPWEKFSAVALGQTLVVPDMHRVADDAFASAMVAFREVLARGFRRPGLVLSEPDNIPNMAGRWSGAYYLLQEQLSPNDRIPPCKFPKDADFAENLKKWYMTHRPDIVISSHARAVIPVLKEIESKVSKKIRLVVLVKDEAAKGLSGVYLDPGLVGATAVDMLVGMMHRHEVGLPSRPHHVLIPGQWVDDIQ